MLSADDRVALYTAPALNRTIFIYIEVGDYTVIGERTDDAGNLWYQLDKTTALPANQQNSINQAWVLARGLTVSGGCADVLAGSTTASDDAPEAAANCTLTLTADDRVALYNGPALNRSVIRFIEAGTYTVIGERTTDGARWYQLDKSTTLPASQQTAINETWVLARGRSVTGDCASVIANDVAGTPTTP